MEDPVADVRARTREDKNERRKKNIFNLLTEKRKLIFEDLNGLKGPSSFTKSKVNELSLSLKRSKKVETIQLLSQAFALQDDFIQEFLCVDGALYGLVGCLISHNESLQMEAATCIVNLATGPHETTCKLLKATSAYLIIYLSSGNALLQEFCAWALGNMAGDCSKCSTFLKKQGLLSEIILLLESPYKSVVITCLFALASFSRTAKACDCLEMMKIDKLSKLTQLLLAPTSSLEVTVEIAAIFFHLSTRQEFGKDMLNVVPAVIHKLFQIVSAQSNEIKETTCLLRCLGNVFAGDTTYVDFAIKNCPELHSVIRSLLQSHYHHIVKETLWTLANIAGCTEGLAILEDVGIISHVIQLMDSLGDTGYQSLVCVYNIALLSDTWRIKFITHQIGVKISHIIPRQDTRTLNMVLALLTTLSQFHPTETCHMLHSTGCLLLLEPLRVHSCQDIKEVASQIFMICR